MKANDFKPHGYCAIANSFCAEIEIDATGERARIAFINSDGTKDVHRWSRIRGVKKLFVYCKGRHYHLDNFMRY